MIKKAIKVLEKDLEIAQLKEEIAKKENESTKSGDPYQIAIKFSDFTKAQGVVNGILQSIETIRLLKEED